MGRLPHTLVGLLIGIGLIAGGGSSDLLEPGLAQATQEGTILMAAQTPMVYDFLSFPLCSKISVKGDDTHPLYRYLPEQSQFPGEVEWNFQKYLVDRSAKVVARYHHRPKPLSDEVVRGVEAALTK